MIFVAALMLLVGVANAADSGDVDFVAVVDEISQRGDRSLVNYKPSEGLELSDEFSSLYFDLFEESGMELAIGLQDPTLKSELESQFGTVIGHAAGGADKVLVSKAWIELRTALQTVAQQYASQPRASSTLLQAFLILLREGFEAILVVTALAAYLRKTGAADKVKVIYQGVGWALAASLITAWILTQVIELSGPAQEALEGITMLVAAAVLFYVSYWLFAKREAGRWQAYVQGQIDNALTSGSLFALGFAAFLAVYREGAETVLFYQALLGQAQGESGEIAAGFALAALTLLGLFWLMRSASLRLPIGPFFAVTAALLYYLAMNFAGTGILELQEAGWVSSTPLEGIPRLPWLGLFPTLESIAAQLALIIPLLFALGWMVMRPRTDRGAAQ